MNLHIIIPVVIFIAVYGAITTELMNKTAAALLGAMLMVIFGVLDQESAFKYIDWNVISCSSA